MGKYQLVRRLATGGMAEVFLAKAAGPMGFEKELVVKRILPHLAEDPRFVEMFLTEAKLAARLNHGNCVQIFDFGEQEDAYFIAMEYVEGLNLRTLARRAFQQGTPISYPLVARIIAMACEGLAYAHELVDQDGKPLGFIHRDISTDNILVSKTGGVKVVDFGIAKAANHGQQTQGGVIKGKLSYLPPEYLMGNPINLTADIYALGIVLYELIAGRKPFVAENEAQLVQLIIHAQPTDVQTYRADVPKALVQVLERALHKNRDARYVSCRQMQADLERFLFQCGEPVGAIQIAELVKTLAAVAEVAPGRRSSKESPAVERTAPWVPKQPTRPMRGPHPDAVTSPDDTLVTPPPPAGNTEREDEELLKLITRPRWHWPAAITALLLMLGGAAIHFSSKEEPPVSAQPKASVAATEQVQPPPREQLPSPSPPSPSPPSPPGVQPALAQKNGASAQDATTQESSKPSDETAQASPEVKPQEVEAPPTDEIPPGFAKLTVTTDHRADIIVGGKLRKKTLSWEGLVKTGRTLILVKGTEKRAQNERQFSKQVFVQLENGKRYTESVTFPLIRVTVKGVPARMTVLSLDDESVDSKNRVMTYEGRHSVQLGSSETGKLSFYECEVGWNKTEYVCTIIGDAH